MTSDIFTPGDVGKVLGIGAQRVRQLEREGKIKAIKTVGGNRVFTREEVERVRNERKKRTE